MLINLRALRAVRDFELDCVCRLLPAGARVLELGGGSGWQAASLAARGFSVESVDVADNPYRQVLEFPVREYDGHNLPFPEASFDVVYSSNVLEHVVELEPLLVEMRRVLKPGGFAIHLMPTPTWRAWTFLTYYFWLPGAVVRMAARGRAASSVQGPERGRGRSRARRLLSALMAPRHGERGTSVGELVEFSARSWRRRFGAAGWRIERDFGVGLFYTGCFVSYPLVSIAARRALSRVLGSGCRVYAVCPQPERI
jgi:SAM-dependent methyltransferase